MLIVLFACSTGSIELGESKDSSPANADDSAPTNDTNTPDSDTGGDTEDPPPASKATMPAMWTDSRPSAAGAEKTSRLTA